ncbi:MAG: DUF3347 domain-containing protein [Lacibacter sp.]
MMRFFGTLSILVIMLWACGNPPEPGATDTTGETIGLRKRPQLSDTLLHRLQQSLALYFDLKENFVAGDTVAINRTAKRLALQLDSLPLLELQRQDTVLFAAVYGRPGDAVAELQAMLAERDLEQKRASFEMVSTVMYDLLKALQPVGVKAYYQYCPMAFEDKGAYWLSATDSIRNPYFGNKMLRCGENKEVLEWK